MGLTMWTPCGLRELWVRPTAMGPVPVGREDRVLEVGVSLFENCSNCDRSP